MATLQTATTRHHHPESLSGALPTNTQLGKRNYQEGEAGRKIFSKAMGGKLTLQVTASKQNAIMNQEMPLLNVWDHPKPGN